MTSVLLLPSDKAIVDCFWGAQVYGYFSKDADTQALATYYKNITFQLRNSQGQNEDWYLSIPRRIKNSLNDKVIIFNDDNSQYGEGEVIPPKTAFCLVQTLYSPQDVNELFCNGTVKILSTPQPWYKLDGSDTLLTTPSLVFDLQRNLTLRPSVVGPLCFHNYPRCLGGLSPCNECNQCAEAILTNQFQYVTDQINKPSPSAKPVTPDAYFQFTGSCNYGENAALFQCVNTFRSFKTSCFPVPYVDDSGVTKVGFVDLWFTTYKSFTREIMNNVVDFPGGQCRANLGWQGYMQVYANSDPNNPNFKYQPSGASQPFTLPTLPTTRKFMTADLMNLWYNNKNRSGSKSFFYIKEWPFGEPKAPNVNVTFPATEGSQTFNYYYAGSWPIAWGDAGCDGNENQKNILPCLRGNSDTNQFMSGNLIFGSYPSSGSLLDVDAPVLGTSINDNVKPRENTGTPLTMEEIRSRSVSQIGDRFCRG